MAVGIELSALCREQEQAGIHAYACEQLGLTPDGQGAAQETQAARVSTLEPPREFGHMAGMTKPQRSPPTRQ